MKKNNGSLPIVLENIKGAVNQENRGPDEILEVIKLTYQDYEYRHKTFWDLLFKSILAIITLMVLPYLLMVDNHLNGLLFIFPTISSMLSVFSMIILKAEGVRVSAIRDRMNALLQSLSTAYKEISIDLFATSNFFRALNRLRIVNVVTALYVFLFAGGIIELILILSQNFK